MFFQDKKKILLAVFFFYFLSSHSQQLLVYDSISKEVVPFATVSTPSSEVVTITNIEGIAKLHIFQITDTLVVRCIGYETQFLKRDENQSQIDTLFLAPLTLKLEEMVVSGSRWQQSSHTIPFQIKSITSSDLATNNPQTAADMLENSGMVFIQKSQQAGGSPMIRGFAANRLVYTVDGVRMNTAIFRSGNIQNVINLDPFTLSKTEVILGPGSVIYGSDAMGGVMSFHTLTPHFSTTQKVKIKGQSQVRYSTANQEKTVHTDLQIGGKKWASLSSFSFWDFGHAKQGALGPSDFLKNNLIVRINNQDSVVDNPNSRVQNPTAYSQWNVMQKIRFSPSQNLEINYGFHLSKTSEYARFDRLNRVDENGKPQYGTWKYGPQKWMMNQLKLTLKKDYKIFDAATLLVAFQQFEESRIDRHFQEEEERKREERIDVYSINVDFTKYLFQKNIVRYGGEYLYNWVDSHGSITNILSAEQRKTSSRYPPSSWQSLAFFFNYERILNPKLNLQSGVRYNHFWIYADFKENAEYFPFSFTEQRLNQGAINGNLGVIFKPNPSWIVKWNVGTAYRSPNIDDIGKIFDSEPGTIVVPNPNLRSEYAYNVDFSFGKIVNKWIKIELTTYATWLEGAMVRRPYLLNGKDSIEYDGIKSQIMAIQNAAKSNILGFHTGIEWVISKRIHFNFNLNYQKGWEEMDDGTKSPVRHAAPIFGNAELAYKVPQFEMKLYANFQGKLTHANLSVSERSKTEIYPLDSYGNTHVPAWYTLNLKSWWKMNEYIQLSAGIENITNQRYRTYGSGISSVGINFIFSVIVKY